MGKTGGISSSDSLQTVIRHAALYLSLLIALYTALVTSGLLGNVFDNTNLILGFGFAVMWFLTGTLQFISFNDSPRSIFVRITWFQILAALYLTFITGIATFPFIACWMIIAIATYSYYKIAGYVMSVTLFWLAAVTNTIVYGMTIEHLISNLSVALSITATMTVILAFLRIQERDENAFEQARREEEIQRTSLLTLVNNLTDAIISTDQSGKIILYNAATVNLLDTNASLEGANIDTVLKLEDETHTAVSFKKLLLGATKLTVNDELHATVGDESIRVELTYSPIRNSSSSEMDDSYIIIMRDITKAKSLEEERDEFISVVSHELRTPIAITEGAIDNAQVIFEKDSTKTDAVKQTLRLAHEQVIFLARMVNDLSTLSRAERGVADEIERIDIKELAHALHNEYEPQAVAKQLRFNLHVSGELGEVNVSRLYLQELLQNFITNAIKYTKEGAVDLIIEAKKDTVSFSVKDSGIGISKADVKRIFEKFYRSEDYRTRETGGTGLGLYVAQKLSKKLGCHIEVKSRLNHGSTFSFSLPKYKSSS